MSYRQVSYGVFVSEDQPGPPPENPPPAMRPELPPPSPPVTIRPTPLPSTFQSHRDLEKQVYEKLGDILFTHHREMDNLPKLGGQSALMGEAVSEKEILAVMQNAANKFFTEMLARTFARRGGMESW